MKFTRAEAAIIVYALDAYRMACTDGELPAPPGGVVDVIELIQKLERALEPEEPDDREYRGIGERHAGCLCNTCRTIIEGQLRAILQPLPIDRRAGLVDRVESSL